MGEGTANLFCDSEVKRRNLLTQLLILVPGVVAFFYAIYLISLVVIGCYIAAPISLPMLFSTFSFLLAATFLCFFLYSIALVIFRVREIALRREGIFLTYVLGFSIFREKKIQFIGRGFLVDLEDEKNWGSRAAIFLIQGCPVVIAERVPEFEKIVSELRRTEPN